MHLQDAFRFCNRIGVRLRNDVTAQATAEVTAAMDPEGRTPFRRSRCPVWSKKDHPALPTNIYQKDGSNVLRWQKTLDKRINHQSSFKTMEEAEKALAVYLNKLFASVS